MIFTHSEKEIITKTIRQSLYFFLSIGFIFFIHFVARHYRGLTFKEHGVVENIQLGLLLSASTIFLCGALLSKVNRTVLLFLSSLSILACFRELDMFFDSHLPIISWKIGFIFPFASIYYALRHLKQTRTAVFNFLTSPAFYMMCCAMFVIIPIAQCVGHKPFIATILGTNDVAFIKRMIEECCEVMGYFLLFTSSIESFFDLVITKNR